MLRSGCSTGTTAFHSRTSASVITTHLLVLYANNLLGLLERPGPGFRVLFVSSDPIFTVAGLFAGWFRGVLCHHTDWRRQENTEDRQGGDTAATNTTVEHGKVPSRQKDVRFGGHSSGSGVTKGDGPRTPKPVCDPAPSFAPALRRRLPSVIATFFPIRLRHRSRAAGYCRSDALLDGFHVCLGDHWNSSAIAQRFDRRFQRGFFVGEKTAGNDACEILLGLRG